MKPARIIVLIASLVAGVALWDWPIFLPFKLLAVMGHETGHALAALVVGGSVDRVSLGLDQGGQCLSMIPDGFFAKVIVYSAGYVGSAIIAVVLLLASFRFDFRRPMLGLACAWLTLMGLFYARDAFTLAFAVVMAVAFAVSAKWLPRELVGGLNLFIASFTALYAVMDLKDDLWNSAVRSQTDAQLLANLTVVPALVWAAVWTVVSIVILFAGAWLALKDGGPKLTPRVGARVTSPLAR
ncbi:MAG: M50 family metallopeptidase [Myxococcaceae bacterium]